MRILNDINYKKYAINQPLNIKQIESIDHWARCITIRILNLKMNRIIKIIFLFSLLILLFTQRLSTELRLMEIKE